MSAQRTCLTYLSSAHSLTKMSDKAWAHVKGPKRLRTWREGAKMTQQAVADAIGIDLAKYNSFENGRQRPGLDHAVAIQFVTGAEVKPEHWTDLKPTAKREKRAS
jgi:transcriptional regulator with XRE-family HTH domain